MKEKKIREWKKVLETDLQYISYELKEMVKAPAVIILEGDLGAGKTTFVKKFVTDGETISPTYSVISETGDIVHADFYRLKTREEIFHLELPLYLEGKNYFLVEWGKEHFGSIMREVPEEFKSYMLSININDKSIFEGKEVQSRNFTLSELEEL